MRRFLSVLVCTGALLSCRPAIQTAGHTLTPEEEALKTGSARRPAVPAISAATTSPDGSLQGSVESPPIEEPPFADLPPGGRVIGDSKPVAVEGLGRAGHWVAHCSLPPGTKLGPRGEPLSAPSLTLTIGDKAEAITALLRSSED